MSKHKKTQAISLFSEFVVPSVLEKKAAPKKEIPPQKRQQSEFASTKDLLSKYQLNEKNQHISHEFQSFGCHLAEVLADKQHTSLYIKLAKTMPRGILERALSFVSDSTADNKAKLFMWKLQKLKENK